MPKRRAWIRPNTFFVRTRGECPFAPNADRQDRDCGHSGDADPAFYSILSQEDLEITAQWDHQLALDHSAGNFSRG